jgi:hypothetical protein
MNGQQLHSLSDVTEFRIHRESLFAGPWLADKKQRGPS